MCIFCFKNILKKYAFNTSVDEMHQTYKLTMNLSNHLIKFSKCKKIKTNKFYVH